MKLLTIIIMLSAGAILSAAPLNVKDFGAVGDGIADDTAAIQKALLAVEKHSKSFREIYANDYGRIDGWGVWDGPNKEIFFPAGNYKISRTLVGGHAVTLSGEDGSVIFTEDPDLLILFLSPAYRISLRNLTFRGGKTHVFFSTRNMDVMSFVAENCTFENSSYFAVDAANYSRHAGVNFDGPVEIIAPWKVLWENDVPTLVEETWGGGAPNSTKFILEHCDFINCAGASGVAADGGFISNCSFVSELPQELPVFISGWTCSVWNCHITANIPADYQNGIIKNPGYLRNVTFRSSSEYGAPLMHWNEAPGGHYAHPHSVTVENCVSASANSNHDDAILWCTYTIEQLKMVNNHEANGNYCKAVTFDNVPVDDAGLIAEYPQRASPSAARPRLENSHSYLFVNNGSEVDTALPAVYDQFLSRDTTSEYAATFPVPEAVLDPIDTSKCNILDAADFGIGYEDSPDDIANLQKLFDEAAKTENPLVRLPGRKFIIPAPLTIPEKCVIRADGRTVFHAEKDTNGVFKVSGRGIKVEIIGILFNGGTNTVDISGAGEVSFNDCVFYDNRTAIRTCQTGEEELLTEVFASSVFSPVFAENNDGEFRFINSWLSISPTLDRGACLRNRGSGTMVCSNICGVPVIFGNFGHLPPRPNWPYGNDIFWFENHGTLRTTHFRYGAEFDGAPGIDQRGSGRSYVEGNYISYWYPTGPHIFLRNESPEGQFGISNVSSYGAITPDASAFCEGVAPDVFLHSNYLHTDYLLFRDSDGTKSLMHNTAM